MSILLLDFGNSRMKVALANGEDIELVRAVEYQDSDAYGCVGALAELPLFTHCFAASVKGPAFDASFASQLKGRFGVEAQWASVACNTELSLAYADPTRLGVDRFLNMLGARTLGAEAALIISAGTAVTFDGLVGERHMGGCIFPGRLLLGDALLHKTSLIGAKPTGEALSCFGNSTEAAVTAGVEQGYLGAVRGISETMLADMPKDSELLLTGGDADRLAQGLQRSLHVESNLLFRGLLRLARKIP